MFRNLNFQNIKCRLHLISYVVSVFNWMTMQFLPWPFWNVPTENRNSEPQVKIPTKSKLSLGPKPSLAHSSSLKIWHYFDRFISLLSLQISSLSLCTIFLPSIPNPRIRILKGSGAPPVSTSTFAWDLFMNYLQILL